MRSTPPDRRTLITWLAALVMLGVTACTSGSNAGSPGPTGSPGPALSAGEIRLSLIRQLGPRWYCDPDEYPVAHGDEQQRAIERWPELQADADLTGAIARSLGIDVSGAVTAAQKLAIYRQWKVATSIPVEVVDASHDHFDYLAQPVGSATEGVHTVGTIDDHGVITVEQRTTSGAPPCPICLSVGTPIDAPDGPIAVDRLRIGDRIWTFDAEGRRIAGSVIALGSTPAPLGHHVVRLVLADGRSVLASPGHPLADGRLLGDVRVGDSVDGSRVVTADLVPYTGDDTYDLVVSGPTGTYLAGGIPMGSTLR